MWEAWKARAAIQALAPVPADVDSLAQFIRTIDGRNKMGAGELAERILERLAPVPAVPEGFFTLAQVEDAYRTGFAAPATYNDKVENDPDEEWANYRANLAAAPQPTQQVAQQEPAQDEPVAWRAWFDADNGARWLFSLWPQEERLEVDWQPLYIRPQASKQND
jgi:hypothetical protein